MGRMSTPLRRLIDLPGVADLEFKAVMKPAMREADARADYPEIDDCVRAIFGLTADEAEAIERPVDWDDIEHKPIAEQVAAFEAAGWDVTDNKRKPLKLFEHFNQPLWLAVRGVAGTLPFHAEDSKPAGWVSKLEAEASRFRKR
jgi:hypothetical protein